MKRLTASKAYKLLIEDVIIEDNDFKKSENRWILHCIYTAIASKRIAERLNIDSDYAMALGYIHDIGRKISHPKHTIEGYKYMKSKGYDEESRICLTHSFIDNDITLSAGGTPNKSEIYEFCSETGFTTIENRLLDISKRKGIYNNSLNHFNRVIELKERLEIQMGCNLYDLFPEIKKKIKIK